MNLLKLFSVIALLLLTSCNIVRVVSDYDKATNFDNYTSFAFFKPGIDKAKISDLDKKRILRAIQDNLMAKGMNKNSNPDILVSIFTKESQRVLTFIKTTLVAPGAGTHIGEETLTTIE